MDEEAARAWVAARFGNVGLVAMGRIVDAVKTESINQNLVSPSTLGSMWSRHIVDSAQLLEVTDFAADDIWIDIGSGAGFPGLVIAALSLANVTLVEPRKRRAAFLEHMIDTLGVASRTRVRCEKIENIESTANIITARAVGHLCTIFAWSSSCANLKTKWILPKGRSAREEVARAEKMWQGTFHVEHSITDPASLIVLASGVARR